MGNRGLYRSYARQREEIASFTARLYERGLTTCSGGNVSVRTSRGHILITPGAIDKAKISWPDRKRHGTGVLWV